MRAFVGLVKAHQRPHDRAGVPAVGRLAENLDPVVKVAAPHEDAPAHTVVGQRVIGSREKRARRRALNDESVDRAVIQKYESHDVAGAAISWTTAGIEGIRSPLIGA